MFSRLFGKKADPVPDRPPPVDQHVLGQLLEAVRDDDLATVRSLIDKTPALADAQHTYGTAIHYAARDQRIEAIELLVAAGANPNTHDMECWPKGCTPLHWAANNGRLQACETLLNCGADINARTLGSWTPLHMAAERNHIDVARLLIARGADVNAKAKAWMPLDDPDELDMFKMYRAEGSTAADWAHACSNAEMCTLLVSHGGTGRSLAG